MQVSELITPERVAFSENPSSKKRSLERLGELLASGTPNLTAGEIFESLIGRERLGSTGLGKGVAIPHGRVAGLEQPLGAFVHLNEAVDFDAIDNHPVDLLFALLVPEQSTDEHLNLLAQLAQMFGDDGFCQRLRDSADSGASFELLRHWAPHRESA